MTTTLDPKEFQTRLRRLDTLLLEVEQFPDPAVQSHIHEILRAILGLHGAGLERLVSYLEAGGAGRRVLDACARDDIVRGLLLLHGLHPLDTEARVRQALEEVRPYLRSHGGNVELLGVDDGVVRLRLEGSCHGCPSSAVTMRQTIEEAILSKAPDTTAVEVEAEEALPATVENGARFALPVL